jgi:hypothetical protein
MNLIYSLRLTIDLQMISPAVDQMCSQGNMQLLPEMSDKLGSLIRNDGLRYTMQTQDARNIQLHVLLIPLEGVHQNEMSKLGKSIDDYPDGAKLAGGEWQTHNKIHADVFPFPDRNIQRLQQSDLSHMISLDSLTAVAFRNIASGLALHRSPPELCLQTMIHLCDARVDKIFLSVGFIKYLLAQLMVLWYHQTILEVESAFLIHMTIVNLRVTFG